MVKINTRPEPIDLEGAKKAIMTHSQTRQGMFHITVELDKPVMVKRFGGMVTMVCSCEGFQNHRKCWHIAWLSDDGEAV